MKRSGPSGGKTGTGATAMATAVIVMATGATAMGAATVGTAAIGMGIVATAMAMQTAGVGAVTGMGTAVTEVVILTVATGAVTGTAMPMGAVWTATGMATGARREPPRGRTARMLALAATFAALVVGCAETRSEIATSFREGRIAKQSYEAGKTRYRARDYAAAVPLFQRTLSHDPQYHDAEVYLGWSYFHLGRYPDATHHFREVTVRQPRWESAWNGLGWSQYRAGQFERALAAFQEAVALDPVYRDAAVGLAYSLFELRRYREALPHLHRLTREGAYLYFPDPDSDIEETRSRYAWCLYYVGQYEKARVAFMQGLQAHPKWHGLHNGLGWTYLRLGDRGKARDSFQRGLALNPDDADARAGLAEASR